CAWSPPPRRAPPRAAAWALGRATAHPPAARGPPRRGFRTGCASTRHTTALSFLLLRAAGDSCGKPALLPGEELGHAGIDRHHVGGVALPGAEHALGGLEIPTLRVHIYGELPVEVAILRGPQQRGHQCTLGRIVLAGLEEVVGRALEVDAAIAAALGLGAQQRRGF